MEKKAKIIATLGPAIFSENKLKTLVKSGVDAFRINFSHDVTGIQKVVSKIRRIEKSLNKKGIGLLHICQLWGINHYKKGNYPLWSCLFLL